ncbi:uncharacterized protein N0V89_011865 [Didymosphaeria variabile]|uniref:Uncharacterized protein n=1 Tax=Didymosphaeria variabile TaxID=1932322 RepID=A0A9W8XBY8_9PLEO|nr:uncharacterized protein N0V89_011865 [Didymosphaeria variabile]KAJ4345730.1 hypothetical protein N0V89_011865 [Didymosphaeria variabile]
MFKPQVFRRSFSLFRRAPTSAVVKSAAHNGNDAIRIQRVRIQKRFFSTSRLVGFAVVTVGIWKLVDWLNEPVEVEDDEELQQHRRVRRRPIPGQGVNENDNGGREITDEEEDEWEDEDEEDEEENNAVLFFPTGFSRPRPRTFYRGSDPEWQTFTRLAPDRERMEKIRGELVTLVRDFAVKNPRTALFLGKVDPTKGAIWIEFKFPDGPPLEYERPGFELTEELTFRRATQLVDPLHHKKLANVLMPTTVANSVYSDMKRRMYSSWLDLRKYAGFEVKESTVQNMFRGIPPSPITPISPKQTPTAPSTPATPAPADAEKQVQPPSVSSPTNPALDKLGISLPDPNQVPTMNLAYFRLMLMKNRKPMNIEPPRGTFVVSGLVEIIGEKAKATLDVTAVYDPNAAKYVMLNAKLRTMTQYKQHPMGGP